MSYELTFWRYKSGVSLDHRSVYERLSDGETVDSLEALPIAQMIVRVRDTFTDWQQLDAVTFDGGDRGGFQLFSTLQFFRVDCYGMGGDDMNRFIELGIEFQCRLYDPQIDRRFDST